MRSKLTAETFTTAAVICGALCPLTAADDTLEMFGLLPRHEIFPYTGRQPPSVSGPDGFAEILAYELDTSDLIITPRTGPWTFGDPVRVAVTPPSHPPHLTGSADLNGDGVTDGVLLEALRSHASDRQISVYLSLPGGGYAEPATYAHGFDQTEFTFADCDADGDQDMLVANFNGLLQLYRNAGDGAFAEPLALYAGNEIHDAAFADIDADGDPDVITARETDEAAIFFNDGAGRYGDPLRPLRVPTGSPEDVVAVDMTGDGKPDLLGIGPDGPTITVNAGGGSFLAPVFVAGWGAITDIASPDLDGDGLPDVVALDSVRGVVLSALNAGGGILGTPAVTHAGPHSGVAAVSDLNEDGLEDVAVFLSNRSVLTPLLSLGDGRIRGPELTGLGVRTSRSTLTDLDGDGDTDILSSIYHATVAMMNDGAGAFTPPVVIFDAGGSTPLDADNDGDTDLLFGHTQGLLLAINDGSGGFGETRVIQLPGPIRQVIAHDVNGDALPDLITRLPSRTELHVAVAGGGYADAGWNIIDEALAVGDINGDGLADILTFDDSANPNYIRYDLSELPALAGQTGGAPIEFEGDLLGCVAIPGDDRDGIIFKEFDSRRLLILVLDDDGAVRVHSVATLGGSVLRAHTGDIDADGDDDLVFTLAYGDGAVIVTAEADGSFRTAGIVPTGQDPSDVFIADVDGDDDADLISMNNGPLDRPDSTIALIRNLTNAHAPCNPADVARPYGDIDQADASGYAGRFLASDPAADLNGDGRLDLTDIVIFVNLSLNGCP